MGGTMQESAKRLRDIVAGKRQGDVVAVNGGPASKLGKQRQQLLVFTVSHQPSWHLPPTAQHVRLCREHR